MITQPQSTERAADPNVETLLDEIDRDPTCIFWG
jgi:hypothetical protein